MKLFLTLFLIAMSLSATSSFAQRRGGGGAGVLDRLIRCERENSTLKEQIYQCQNEPRGQTQWSCQAGCQGSGNVGFGSGTTEADARKAALTDLGLICSHHTFECNRE